MSWEFMIWPYAQESGRVRPILDDERPVPPCENRPRSTVAQVVAAIAAAGLRGQLGFDVAGLELPAWDGDRDRDLGTVYLSTNAQPGTADSPINLVTLYKPGETTLAATLALRPLLGSVVVCADDDDLPEGLLLVRDDDDPAALAEVWPIREATKDAITQAFKLFVRLR